MFYDIGLYGSKPSINVGVLLFGCESTSALTNVILSHFTKLNNHPNQLVMVEYLQKNMH